MDGFRDCFSGVEDPRSGNARRHDLQELLVMALCTVLCGGESCVDMADFAEEKEGFFGNSSIWRMACRRTTRSAACSAPWSRPNFGGAIRASWGALPRPAGVS